MGYATLNEAINAAVEGDNILLCDSQENINLDKTLQLVVAAKNFLSQVLFTYIKNDAENNDRINATNWSMGIMFNDQTESAEFNFINNS